MPWVGLARNRVLPTAAVPARCSGCRCSWPSSPVTKTTPLPPSTATSKPPPCIARSPPCSAQRQRECVPCLNPGAPTWTAPPPTGMGMAARGTPATQAGAAVMTTPTSSRTQ
eukprot:scaffold6568_cov60-Phaeocystis_antarctica.AAC.6